MIIWTLIPCLAVIEDFVDQWGWSIVGDLENGRKTAAKHVGQIYKAG